jgi:probable HAF family extracellular repeat protein
MKNIELTAVLRSSALRRASDFILAKHGSLRGSLFTLVLFFLLLAGLAGVGSASYVKIDLGTLGGSESQADDINASGQVVGQAQTAAGAWHAFSWTRTGGMVDLGTLGGGNSFATAVNASGQV